MAESPVRAAGSRTAGAFRGRSCRAGSLSCSVMRTRTVPAGPWKRCSRWASSRSPGSRRPRTAPSRRACLGDDEDLALRLAVVPVAQSRDDVVQREALVDDGSEHATFGELRDSCDVLFAKWPDKRRPDALAARERDERTTQRAR